MMTGNFTSVARPYAIAAFEFALEKKSLPAWDEMLQTAAVVAQDQLIKRFMASPEVAKMQLAELFCDVLKSTLDNEKGCSDAPKGQSCQGVDDSPGEGFVKQGSEEAAAVGEGEEPGE